MEDPASTEKLKQDSDTTSSQQLKPGALLANRYLILGIIGIGGMSTVYRAKDNHFPNVTKLVAVKEMINRALDPVMKTTVIRNFEREANILASLDHRSIPRIYDYFTLNDCSYLVIEFISGSDLEVILEKSNEIVPEERVIPWAIELCDVLSYLHNHQPDPIIFRDIKPSNVMVNDQDHIILVDFGIARPFQVGQRGTMIGTEGYSPPEQYRGDATPLADIYSLGATLHHLLSNHDPRLEPPFSFLERPIRQFNPKISAKLEDTINKAVQYDPEDRYQSAEEMKAALVEAAQEIGIPTPSAFRKHHSRSLGGLVEPVWSFQCEDEIRGSPTYFNKMVYVGCYDNNVYALNAEDGAFFWKYPTDGGIVSKPAIQEDSLFVGSEDYRMHAIHLRTGKVNWTYYTEGPVRSSPHLAEGHVFIGSDDGFLHAVNAVTGRPAWKQDAGSPIRSTAVVADELVYFGTEAGDLYCLDLTGKVKWRFKAKRAITSTPVIHKKIVYFCSVDSYLYALDANTGWVIWRYRLNKPSISSPSVVDHLLFTGAIDGSITCIDINTTKSVWQFNAKHQVTGSALIYREALYIGSVDGHIYCLDYQTGKQRWKYLTKGLITGTPCSWEDLIFIGSTDHYLYSFAA